MNPTNGTFSFDTALEQVLPVLQSYLTSSQLATWLHDLDTIRNQPGGEETAHMLLEATPDAATLLTPGSFSRWVRLGRDFSAVSQEMGLAFFRASPVVLRVVGPGGLSRWADQAQRLLGAGDDGRELATEFLEVSPALFSGPAPSDIGLLVDLLASIPPRPAEMALSALRGAARAFPELTDGERSRSLEVAAAVATTHPWAVGLLFDTIASVVPRMAGVAREDFVRALGSLVGLSPLQFSGFLREVGGTNPALSAEELAALLPTVVRIASRSLGAAHELLGSAPALFQRLRSDQLDTWCRRGEEMLSLDEGAAVSYFRLQSQSARSVLATLSAGVSIGEARDVLELYCKALMGRDITVVAAEDLQDRSPHWVGEELSFESPSIFAPSLMQEYGTKQQNFEAYKVLMTHQTGHVTFGTYQFDYERPGAVFQSLRPLVAPKPVEGRPWAADLERFFDVFNERRFARELFTLADDQRIDTMLRREYRGIRRPLDRVQESSLDKRPDLSGLPLRAYVMELLVRQTLGGYGPYRVPDRLEEKVRTAAGIVSLLSRQDITVEDAAEATIRLYTLLRQVPNVPQHLIARNEWTEIDLRDARYDPATDDLTEWLREFARVNPQDGPFPGNDEPAEGEMSEEEEPFMPPPPVPHRGEHQPEMMQALMNLADRSEGEPLTEEEQQAAMDMLQEMADRDDLQTAEEDLQEADQMDLSSMIRRYMASLMDRDMPQDKPSPIVEGVAEDDLQTFYYDEWDYRIKTFRPGWCELHQRTLKEGTGETYERTLQQHQWLAYAVRKQFEMLRPEGMNKVKKLLDGEEFDLDALIESVIDKRAGDGLKDKIYWRRRKTERSVSVALLLDMSLSTDERIDQDVRSYAASQLDVTRSARGGSGKRIIDLEKESLVLLMEALAQLGDQFGIYGFSSAGRGDVQYFVIKDLFEPLSDHVKNRLDKIVPLQGTRMGAALRHTSTKLLQTEAQTRVLLLLTDGRPQDRGYGTLPWELEDANKGRYRPLESTMRQLGPDGIMSDEKEYAVRDTKSALTEARDKGITPFCISIDKEGHDYLKAMCSDIGYEVVSSIEALPRRLPALYRRLTT